MAAPATWRGVINGYYNPCEKDLKEYFYHLPSLAQNYPWDVSISYLFSRVELAHNMTIYCSVVKLHRVDSELAKIAVNKQHMTREGFRELFKSITGKSVRKDALNLIKEAEEIRDQILHGKSVTEEQKRKAVCDIIEYAKKFNDEVSSICGFKPFGSLTGFKGRAESLDKSTSRWVLKGIGFDQFQ